ncbi:cytochrome P450 [Russula ochroleuca]|uniref:Cytochrome P450 n=1 Tax=Russula ochroleuca TaxID=152965 RepID=A0A9P5T7Y2_9AGAM|nr:cytochrome P450 [Russula ochroleuca]
MTLDNDLAGANAPSPSSFLSHASFSQLLALMATVVVILVAQYVRSPWRKVPPGPKGLPILGNALQLQNKDWMYGAECKRKFEHIMYINALGQPIVVLHSLKAASELFDRRAKLYSDRPRFIVAQDILCGGLFTALMPYGDVWRRTRRAAHEVLTKVAVRNYHPMFCKEGILLATAMLENPDASDKHLQRSSASATISILYDYPTLENEHDKTLTEIHTFINRISAAGAPGAHLVELFHWMIHIPARFAKWKREAMEHFRQHSAIFNGLLDTVSNDIAKGSERPSVSASLIKNSNRSGLSNTEIAWLLGTLYSAGAETTATTLAWWTRAMVAHPEIQKRAQDELDAVVGRSRTPTFADAPNLPYIQALVKESLRWRPALPLGVPHTTTKDDWYEGMFIPKGTMCMVNLWQCHHDPASYGPDAASFNPERFLDEHGRLIPGPVETRDDGHSTYGFGRRACVGKHAANDSLFINIATVLWAARLECARDENGKEIPPDTETTVDLGTVFQPVPYKCKITPRFPEAPSLLVEELELLRV